MFKTENNKTYSEFDGNSLELFWYNSSQFNMMQNIFVIEIPVYRLNGFFNDYWVEQKFEWCGSTR